MDDFIVFCLLTVAPRVGAWIETLIRLIVSLLA